VLCLVVAFGLLLVAIANRAAADGVTWGDLPFFAGLLVIVVPISLRLLQVDIRASESAGLVLILGMALYACKVLHDPVVPGGYDEYLHLRTAQDIVASHVLFLPNVLLSVSPYYPGMELVTAAVSQMSGMSVYESGIVVLGVARIALSLGLFFLFAMATSSTRVAGIAAAIYMTNPHFLYFDSQFAYESLALPLAVAVLYLVVRRGHAAQARWLALSAIAVLTIFGVVTTHHVTAALLALFLLLWAGVAWVLRIRDRSKPGRPALLTSALIALWATLIALPTFTYLEPVLTAAVGQIVEVVSGSMTARQLFVSRAGDTAPLWEKLIGFGSAAVVLLLLGLGLLVVYRRYRDVPIVLALGLIACIFPLTLLARFSPIAAEVASRTPEYLFLAIAPIMALRLARLAYRGHDAIFQLARAAGVMVILVVGGVFVGMSDWSRLPGPYLVSADGRSVDAEGVAAASWTQLELGDDRTFAADRVNRLLLSAYGRQAVATTYATGLPIRNLFLSDKLGATERRVAQSAGVEFVLTDHRLTTGLPVVGHYFDRGEEVVVGIHDSPLDPRLLDKFDANPEISRIFDGGDIRIYDVRQFRDGT